ncbi:TonB-dependent siderophore receptor [Polluticoccus soli]|uniref:TonB-dependent siderophore receptor n=1 Tax=Polluticoccus soli TaxID=3034150 RepID=UPI0023E2D6EA|nr:TonB-dependent siderophore receptor [Flavipsychrobacter sp. JY13-12]
MKRSFILFLLSCSTAAFAQTGEKKNDDAKELDEVVIRGNANKYKEDDASQSLRLKTPLLEVPQNIQVVTIDALKDQQVISMSDGLIRNVSGLVRMEHWGDMYTNITARGSQIQAFRNGFNVVNSYWGPLTEDMSFVKNIEFVKGPAGFMLSSGDPSGLYNVVTKKPTGISKGEASFTMGSFDLYRAALDLDGKLSKNGKLLYRLNMAAQNKKSHRANEYNNRYTIAPVISYQLDDKTKLTLEYNYQRANMSNVGSFYVFAPNDFATLPVDFTTLPSGMPGTVIHDHSVYANLQHNINTNWKLTAQVGRFMYDQEGSSMWPTSVNADGTMIRNVGIWDARSRMTMGQAFVNGDVQTGAIRHRILGGLDMANKDYMADWSQSHNLDDSTKFFDPRNPDLGAPVNGYPQFDRETPLAERAQTGGTIDQAYTSLYLQDELGFFKNTVRLTLAARYTDLKQSQYGGAPDKAQHFTPRAGLSVSIDKETSIYALYDQAFIPQSGILSNGGKVQPMTGNNSEIGIKKEWFGGKWSTNASVYRIIKNNELTSDPTQPVGSGLSIELGQKVSEGIEFDLRGTIAPGLNLVANYAYTDSRLLKVAQSLEDSSIMKVRDIVPGFAKHTANVWLTYQVQEGILRGAGISAGGTFLGDRNTYWDPSPDGKKIDDYLKLDGGLFWQNDKLKITANVFNILNEYLYSGSYYAWLNAYNWQTEAPRNYRVSIAYKF